MPVRSIIIPCHNEALRLEPGKFSAFLQQRTGIHLLFVNDGSTDNTQAILEQIRHENREQVTLLSLTSRSGKGEAVRRGMMESLTLFPSASVSGYMDADLSVSLEEIDRLFELFHTANKRFILGSRVKKIGARITRNEWRHFYSRIIATIVGSIIRLDVYDTQCSAKLFRQDTIETAFSNPFRTKWLFDVEIICRLYNAYGPLNDNGLEEPLLEWTERKGSKLRWYSIFRVIREVFILKKYYTGR